MYLMFKNFKKKYDLTPHLAKKYLEKMEEGIHYFTSPLDDIFLDEEKVHKFMQKKETLEIDVSKYLK